MDYIVTCVAKVNGNVLIKAGVVIEFEDDAAARGNELAHEMELEVGASIQFGGDVGVGGDKVDIDDI